jgi:hypothetical protein
MKFDLDEERLERRALERLIEDYVKIRGGESVSLNPGFVTGVTIEAGTSRFNWTVPLSPAGKALVEAYTAYLEECLRAAPAELVTNIIEKLNRDARDAENYAAEAAKLLQHAD